MDYLGPKIDENEAKKSASKIGVLESSSFRGLVEEAGGCGWKLY
jgi:hypothetical protein